MRRHQKVLYVDAHGNVTACNFISGSTTNPNVFLDSYHSAFMRIRGWVLDCSNPSAKALELLQSCTKPLICLSMISSVFPLMSIVFGDRLIPLIPVFEEQWVHQWTSSVLISITISHSQIGLGACNSTSSLLLWWLQFYLNRYIVHHITYCATHMKSMDIYRTAK